MNSKNSLLSKNGFTLIELLIIIAILGTFTMGLLATIDPFEQFKKASDSVLLGMISEIDNAITRTTASKTSPPWEEEVTGITLSSPIGKQTIEEMVRYGELKDAFLNSSENKLSKIYFSSKIDSSFYSLCFFPQSKSYRKNSLAKYSKDGQFNNECNDSGCYLCIVNGISSQLATNNQNSNSQSAADTTCNNFDPEYPQYPWTCNYSNKWIKYGCSNYCVMDLGCKNCPSGQRRLQKNYYFGFGGGSPSRPRYQEELQRLYNCQAHESETMEEYCISDEPAGCNINPYRSSDLEFDWGCTNPRRPYQWKKINN